MGTLALIGLGSNLGDRAAHLGAAVAALTDTPGITIRAVSQNHETAPVGGPGGQGAFLNAAALLDTALDPFALQARLHQIESEAGRLRSVHWGERTLDLDLLLFGDQVVDTADLTIPHLRMAVRRFVLAPASEIAPDLRDPLTRQTVRQLLANLDRRPSILALTVSVHQATTRQTLFDDLVRSLGAVGLDPQDPIPDALPTDRWVVLNSWLPDPHALAGFRESAARPTFVVLAGDPAAAHLSSMAPPTSPNPDALDVPLLRIRGNERVMDAILAACEASRAGLIPAPPTLPSSRGSL